MIVAVAECAATPLSDDDAIRMSVLNAILEIQTYRATHPGAEPADAAQVLANGLAASAGFAYPTALALSAQIPSLLAPADGPRPPRLRTLVEQLIVQLAPVWACAIPKGRRYVATYIAAAAYQCLESAGLYDRTLDDDALAWWDRVAAIFRSELDTVRTATGRRGERLTVEREARRLAEAGRPDLAPEWVALEDNALGYDVRSFDVRGSGPIPRYIEVKATEARPPRFFLSRNEWETAVQFGDRFQFHVWYLPTELLEELPVAAVAPHIPQDRADGRWQRVEITLR